jgi:7-cyano-7-deazaguanine synthase in queuosine biosynthesis
MKMAVFWVEAPCSLVSKLLIALMMEAARTSETLVKLYQTTRCFNPEDSHRHCISCCSCDRDVYYLTTFYQLLC